MRCFERLGHGELSPDQAIQAGQPGDSSNRNLSWAMPLALGLWMNKRYSEALEVLQRPGVETACGHMAYFHALVGMVARQVHGNHRVGSPSPMSVHCRLNLIVMTRSTTWPI